MKRILTMAGAIFMACSAIAQAPERMTYQAVVRDAQNEIVANQGVSVEVSITQTTVSGTVVFEERHSPSTNVNGLFTIILGTGTPLSGSLGSIDWSQGPYFLNSNIDPTGGSNYSIQASTQLVSVPYAMYAEAAGSIANIDVYLQNNASFDTAVTNIINSIGLSNPVIDASISNDSLFLSLGDGSTVNVGFIGGGGAGGSDDQNLTSAVLSGGLLTLSIENGNSVTVDLSSLSAGNAVPNGVSQGDLLYWNGSSWVVLGIGNEGENLTICGGIPQWTDGPFCTPTVIIDSLFEVSGSTAKVAATIQNQGASAVTSRGLCYSTSPLPSLSNNVLANGNGLGSFVDTILGLNQGVVYYVRAYATNGSGTAYSAERAFVAGIDPNPSNFTCGDTVQDIDGNEYPTVQIGNQCWFAKNLRTTRYSDGTSIDFDPVSSSWSTRTDGAWVYPNNSSSLNFDYGKLYNWYVLDSLNANICPAGWHVPSELDLTRLSDNVIASGLASSSTVGRALKSAGGWYQGNSGTDVFGFSWLPAGEITSSGNYDDYTEEGLFWTTTSISNSSAFYRKVTWGSTFMTGGTLNKKTGLSLRCVQD